MAGDASRAAASAIIRASKYLVFMCSPPWLSSLVGGILASQGCLTPQGGAVIRKPVLVVAAMLLATFQVLAQQAPDRVQVRYLAPEKFTDAGRYWGGDASREHNLAELARHIERRAARLLPEGQRLLVSITDIDLAGGYEPWRRNLGDVRVVRDAYPPRIDLSFRLEN